MNLLNRKHHLWDAAVIFFIAFGLRLAFELYLRQHYPFYDYPSDDVGYYRQWAQDISRRSFIGNETFWGLPLYPYFLALLDRWFFGNAFLIRVFHLFLGSLNCVFIYAITNAVFSRSVALTAGILTAVSFTCVYYDWLMMPPLLLIFLAGIIVLTLLHKDQLKTKRQWVYLGLLLGIAMLGDGKFLFLFVFICLYELKTHQKECKAITTNVLLPLLIGMITILFLSGLRNKLVGGDWVWISAQSGLTLYSGNNPQAKGYYEHMEDFRPTHFHQDIDQILVAEKELGRPLTPAQVSQFYRNKAVQFIVQQPAAFTKLLLRKLHLFLIESENTFDMDLIFLRDLRNRLDINPFALIGPLAILGMLVTRKAGHGKVYLYLLIASQLALVLVFYMLDRYRASILPFLIIFEAAALLWLAEQIKQKQILKLIFAVLFVLGFTVFFQRKPLDAASVEFLKQSKLGYAYEKEGKLPQAQKAYLTALSIRPNDTNAFFNLGNTYVAQNNLAMAKKCYERVLHHMPHHVDAIFNLAHVEENLGNPAAAKQKYAQVLELTPQSIDALYLLGTLYLKEQRCEQALSYFHQIIQLNPAYAQEIKSLMESCLSP
ncbi:MAG TPA: tetratricopeptide repeat protein [Candidatus Omnitrophota bacterium]|nr:tetratricopeptide repeat protein [Candidatus Omnitrophota bacterium]